MYNFRSIRYKFSKYTIFWQKEYWFDRVMYNFSKAVLYNLKENIAFTIWLLFLLFINLFIVSNCWNWIRNSKYLMINGMMNGSSEQYFWFYLIWMHNRWYFTISPLLLLMKENNRGSIAINFMNNKLSIQHGI